MMPFQEIEPQISFQDVSVDFPIFDARSRSAKRLILETGVGGWISQRKNGTAIVRALDSLNFRFGRGERVALLGHNGAGKTTLLQVIGGVYQPTAGVIDRHGQVSSMMNLSLGINVERTGLENIVLKSSLHGLSREDVERASPGIAEFTELGEYLNFPVRTYSEGMKLRLSFAIATSIPCDILLMDEWIEFADQSFAAKAQRRIHDMVERTGIVFIASHSEALITNICTRAIVLQKGKAIADATPREAFEIYADSLKRRA